MALLLSLDACSRPNDPYIAASDVGLWLRGRYQFRGSRHPHPYPYIIIRDEEGVDRIDYSPLEGRPYEGEIVFDYGLMCARVSYSGFWGMTRRYVTLYVDDDVKTIPEADRRRWGQLMDDYHAANGVDSDDKHRRAARMFRDGVYSITEDVPSGRVHNAVAISLAAALLWTSTLGRPWRSWGTWWLVRARDYWLGRSMCPRCHYDVRGYPGTVCPECGHDWGDSQPRPSPRRGDLQ